MTPKPRWLLVADDQETVASAHARFFESHGWKVLHARTLVDVKRQIAIAKPEWALIEQRLADGSAVEILQVLRAESPGTRVVVVTRFASLTGAVRSMRAGAHNYLSKPVAFQRLLQAFDDDQVLEASEIQAHANTLARMEWEFISDILLQCEGNISRAARVLGVDRRGLRRKLARGST